MGTSRLSHYHLTHAKDHPHAYGDKKDTVNEEIQTEGSSPRVWGQVHDGGRDCSVDRIIPTRMGTRSSRKIAVCTYRDHPHAYGDKYMDEVAFETVGGSSPRVWGQAFQAWCRSFRLRIIPTRMGTRTSRRYKRGVGRDHPHAYGDKSSVPSKYNIKLGSSPRVWGQESRQYHPIRQLRIIPTRMGTRQLCRF